VLIAVERLLLKIRQPASRADELAALRARVRHEVASAADDEERVLAAEVRSHKLRAVEAFGAVSSCGSCSRDTFSGGDCCSGVTAELFDDRELAALVHAGTRVRHLTAPHGEHAGCAFRGPHSCTLEIKHRPARCVHYVCDTLRRELHDRGRLAAVEAELAELNRAMQRFGAVHQARVDRDVLTPLIDAIAAATDR
jgi:hypothetical protein